MDLLQFTENGIYCPAADVFSSRTEVEYAGGILLVDHPASQSNLMLIFFLIFAHLMQVPAQLAVTSPDFKSNGAIPSKFTCEGTEINPALAIKDTPKAAKSLVVIIDDTYAPGQTYDHWVMWNIPPTETIPENSAPGVQGKNGSGESKYKGPCPPTGTHKYLFRVYALDVMLDTKPGADKKMVENAIRGHVLAKGELVGTYKKSK